MQVPAIISTLSAQSLTKVYMAAVLALFTYARDIFFSAGLDEHSHVVVCETIQQNLEQSASGEPERIILYSSHSRCSWVVADHSLL